MKKNKLQKKLQKFFSSGFRGFVAVSLVIGLLSGNVVSVKAGELGNYGDSDFSFPKFSELNGIRNSDKFNNGENCIYKWGGTSMVYIGKVSSSTSGSCSSNVILKSDLYNKIYNTDFLKIDGGNISLKGIPGKYFTKIYNWVYEDIKPCPDGTYNTGSLVHRCESDSFKENGKYGYHTSTGLFIIPQAGQYFNENGKDIKPCPDGTYQDESGKNFCKVAGVGEYVNSGGTGTSACTLPANAKWAKATYQKMENDPSDTISISYWEFGGTPLAAFNNENYLFYRFNAVQNGSNVYWRVRNDALGDSKGRKIIGNTSDTCRFVCDEGNGFEISIDGNSCVFNKNLFKQFDGNFEFTGWNTEKFKFSNGKYGVFDANGTLQIIPAGKYFNTSTATDENCPDLQYQPNQGQDSCLILQNIPENFGICVNSAKTGTGYCDGVGPSGLHNQKYVRVGSDEKVCVEGWKNGNNLGICNVCADGYLSNEHGTQCIAENNIVKENKKNFQKIISDNSDTLNISIDDDIFNGFIYFKTGSGNSIKSEIENFFSKDVFENFATISSGTETFIDRVNNLLSDYDGLINYGTGYLSDFNNAKEIGSSIKTDFENKVANQNSTTFDSYEFSTQMGNFTGYIAEMKNKRDLIFETINNLNGKKNDIETLYEDFINKKSEILDKLKLDFNNRKIYFEKITQTGGLVNKIAEFQSNQAIVDSYFDKKPITSIVGFGTKNDFRQKISSYTGILAGLGGLENDIDTANNDVLNLQFGITENGTGTGIDVLNQKIQILNDAIQNYNDSVSSGTVLISEIENLYSIFEEYAEANPLDSIEDLEFKNEMKLKANEEEEIIAENIYYSMIDDFDFSDKTNISVSNLPVIDFSIVEDFSDDLGPNYSKTLRENRIKNIITDKLNEKLSEINIQISRGGVNEATLDNFIDLGGKNINEVQISSTGTIANADDFVKSMISDTSKTLNENLKIQNKAILDSAKLVSGMTKNARIRDAEKKIKTLKKMLLVVKKQEQAYNSMEKISGCEPGDEITEKGGIKYNKDLMSCSKSDFKKDIDNQKRKIFDGLFDLSQKLNTEFIAYKDNLENSVFTDLNVVIDENGNSTCKPGTVDMGKGCVDLGKVKTQGIAYGSDAGAVVLDPFDCANATDTRACLELKNGLRLTMSGSKILIKGIVYSTEVGPIKFGGISADLDSTFETMEKLTLNDATRSGSENKKIANKVYGEIIGGFDFKDANGNFVSTGTISSNLDTIFTNNYSNFTNLDLFGDKSERILSIKNLVKEKFYSTLENLKNVENNLGIARNIVGSGEIIFDNAIQFSPFLNYLDKNIFQRIKIYNLVDNLIDVNGDLTFPDLATFKDQIHIQNFEVILNAYLNNSNYSNIQNNLKENLIVLKKSQEKIGINIISGNGLYSNILNLNSQVLNFTDTGSITASSILGKIDEIKSKINVIKEQLKYLDKQNQNMINYGKIDGCSPNETQIIDGIVMNKDGKLPCSKIDFDKKIKDQKVEILNQLFTLVEEYKTEIRNYSLVVSNNLRSKNQSWIDSDGNGYCKVGTIQVGNGCIDPANIKIKGIAYGSDSGPVILDPFKCSTANASGKYGTDGAYDSVGECRIAKNALRFEIKNGKLSLVGLAYSPEVGPIKFGGIGSGMDASFGTNSNGTDIKKSCLEIKNQGLSNGDGVYLIDPDGVGIGEDAFEVYCNMNNY